MFKAAAETETLELLFGRESIEKPNAVLEPWRDISALFEVTRGLFSEPSTFLALCLKNLFKIFGILNDGSYNLRMFSVQLRSQHQFDFIFCKEKAIQLCDLLK